MQIFITIFLPMSFSIRPLFNPWLSTHLYYPCHLCCLRPTLPSIKIAPTSVVKKVILMAINILTAIATTTTTCMIFMVFRALFPPTSSRATSSRTEGTPVLHGDLLTGPLSRALSVSFAFSLATPPLNAFSFTTLDNSRLPILLLVMFLLLPGSRTQVRINMSCLILRL